MSKADGTHGGGHAPPLGPTAEPAGRTPCSMGGGKALQPHLCPWGLGPGKAPGVPLPFLGIAGEHKKLALGGGTKAPFPFPTKVGGLAWHRMP